MDAEIAQFYFSLLSFYCYLPTADVVVEEDVAKYLRKVETDNSTIKWSISKMIILEMLHFITE